MVEVTSVVYEVTGPEEDGVPEPVLLALPLTGRADELCCKDDVVSEGVTVTVTYSELVTVTSVVDSADEVNPELVLYAAELETLVTLDVLSDVLLTGVLLELSLE